MLDTMEQKARLARHVTDMRDIAEESVRHIEGDLFQLAANSWHVRRDAEVSIGEYGRPAFRALDSMVGFMHATARFLQTDERAAELPPPTPIPYVASALNVRACSVAHEICAMLRAGFPIGAHARWRTLHELDVVAHVLLEGNRGTAARFVNHRWIQYARDKKRDTHLGGDGQSSEAMRNLYIRRYGAEFAATYGWAAELSKRRLNVKKPNMAHLEQIANLDGHASRVHAAHHGVHADAIGILHLIDESGLFHSGARLEGISTGCLQTVRVLGEINDAILGIWNRHARSSATNTLRYLNDELCLVLQEDISTHLLGDESVAAAFDEKVANLFKTVQQ
jgi:hypothetical protein